MHDYLKMCLLVRQIFESVFISTISFPGLVLTCDSTGHNNYLDFLGKSIILFNVNAANDGGFFPSKNNNKLWLVSSWTSNKIGNDGDFWPFLLAWYLVGDGLLSEDIEPFLIMRPRVVHMRPIFWSSRSSWKVCLVATMRFQFRVMFTNKNVHPNHWSCSAHNINLSWPLIVLPIIWFSRYQSLFYVNHNLLTLVR